MQAEHHCTQPLHRYLVCSVHGTGKSVFLQYPREEIDVFIAALEEAVEFLAASSGWL